MSEKEIFTGKITPDLVVSFARLASEKIAAEGLVDPKNIVYRYPLLEHEGSKSRYLAEQPIGNSDMLYVALMGPHGKTTQHFHEAPVIEHYKPIAGQLFINGKPVPPEGVSIFSGEVHQASTQEQGSLTVIFMENGATKSPEQRHIPANKK